MALFKIFRGLSSALPQTITDGYCYYTTDDNKFYIDANSTRKCINNIPTALSALSDDASHRLVTDTQISTWNAKSDFSGSYSDLSNKPTLGTASEKDVPTSGNASTTQVVMGDDTRLSDARSASDVYSWAKASTKPTYTASEVGAIASTLKGTASGVAELDANGLVPSSQLPSFVDDVIEGYYDDGKFYEESTHTTEITGETGKIYVDLSTNVTYRWSGTAFVGISASLALGETDSTAYRGDRGKTAYDHSQSAHAPSDATKTESSSTNGNIKISGSEVTVYTHPTDSGNKHIPSGGSSGKFLKWASDGTASWEDDNDTWTAMVGATSSSDGSVGYVNATPPSNGYNTKFLRADGTWNVPVTFSVSGTELSITA